MRTPFEVRRKLTQEDEWGAIAIEMIVVGGGRGGE